MVDSIAHALELLRHPRATLRRFLSSKWEFQTAFDALSDGDVAIDCGAGTGVYTAMMADREATVYAFEPNPWAFEKLRERVGSRPNVHLRQAAVGATDGVADLYLHRFHAQDEVGWSAGSSLFAAKPNVSPDTVSVDVVSLPEFLRSTGRITLLKMDIEGSEIAVLETLHAMGLLAGIESVLVEMHDRKIAELAERGALLRELVERSYPNVNLNWA